MKEGPTIIIRAGAVRDAAGADLRPGILGLRDGRVVAVAEGDRLPGHHQDAARVIDLPDRLLLPGLVNAHAHLDLTGLGPRAYDGDFPAWLRHVAAHRPVEPDAVAAAVRRGVALSRQAGVVYLGDLAYSTDAIHARQSAESAWLSGVSYLECFGLGARQPQRIAQLRARLDQLRFEALASAAQVRGVVVGIAPHSPYTVGRAMLDAVCELSENRAYRLTIHAAETLEEIAFLRDGSGPYADHARHYGCTDADIADTVTGLHPIDHLEPHLRKARWLLAHCNHLEDRHLDLLRRAKASVAYCPVASAYFGHPRHRYRDLLDAGVAVALGTDSILCQSPDNSQPMSVFAQMRFLHQRDGTHPQTLLAMATVHGLRALLIDDRLATFAEGMPAMFAGVPFDPADATDALTQALRRGDAVTLVEPA